jgi:hypothetical protein
VGSLVPSQARYVYTIRHLDCKSLKTLLVFRIELQAEKTARQSSSDEECIIPANLPPPPPPPQKFLGFQIKRSADKLIYC